ESRLNVDRSALSLQYSKTDFVYQFGEGNLSAMLDKSGNLTTLLFGFLTQLLGGESVYILSKNALHLQNGKNYCLHDDGVCYDYLCEDFCSKLQVNMLGEKSFELSCDCAQKCKVIFDLKFCDKYSVKIDRNVFSFSNNDRTFSVGIFGDIETFTCDKSEFTSDKPRISLQKNTTVGDGLTVVMQLNKGQNNVKFTLFTDMSAVEPKPLLSESLISTYLNYFNDKSVYCIKNKLVRLDALTLAGITYTNSAFVKEKIETLSTNGYLFNKKTYFYNEYGKLVPYTDAFTLSLSLLYYVILTGDRKFLTKFNLNYLMDKLINSEYSDGRDKCLQALCLRKLIQLDINRLTAIERYERLKTEIMQQPDNYRYAQAIGAVEMNSPSKQRLKDLCSSCKVPKSWYYVSQLENLYGLSVNCDKLNLRPRAQSDLEQFVISYNNKRFVTEFRKGGNQIMLLNGNSMYSCFAFADAQYAENKLVVQY
ncbi:MAG: hypothetical protein RRY18_03985, partial [Clostridia bacterium]